uniref:Complexin-2 n=1 Tax=Bos indicus x Bos taurus TaxID=30522 RepID=A0A4W2I184_BOBOX
MPALPPRRPLPPQPSPTGATKDMGKMLGGEEEKDPDAQKKEEERQEALRQQEEERKAKHARMEAEREKVRQQIRDKYGLKKKEEKEAEEKAALEQPCEGSLTRPKKAIPAGCGDEEEEEEESILDTVLKYLPGPLQDMFKKVSRLHHLTPKLLEKKKTASLQQEVLSPRREALEAPSGSLKSVLVW